MKVCAVYRLDEMLRERVTTAKQVGVQRTYMTRLNRKLGIQGPRLTRRPDRTRQGPP